MSLLPEDEFRYFINAKKHILVVSYLGILKKSGSELFSNCQKEILDSKSDSVIFNLTGLKDLANDMFPVFSNLQLSIRDQNRNIIVCGLNTNLRAPLQERGVIRNSEVVSTLIEALQKIINPEATTK